MWHFHKTKKTSLIVLISIFAFVQLFGLLFLVKPVSATGLPVAVTADVPGTTKEVKQTIGSLLLSTALGALLNAGSYFLRKIAYDSAMYLATGGKGQGSQIFGDSAGDYFAQVGRDSLAEGIGSLGEQFGLNLCQLPELDLQVSLQINLRSMYDGTGGPKPNCDWQSLKNGWSSESFKSKYGKYGEMFSSDDALMKTFSDSIKTNNTDFGIAVGAMGALDRNKAAAETGANTSRLEGQGFKAAEELISGKVKQPAQVVQEESLAITNKGQSELNASQTAGIYGSGAKAAVLSAVSTFLNTFISQGIKTLQDKMYSSGSGDEGDTALSFESAGFQSNRNKARQVFSEFLTIKIGQRSQFHIVEDFVTCPPAPIKPGLNNCVIDTKFRDALNRAKTGEPITIQEAMNEGLLEAGRILVSPRRVADNTSIDCRLDKYCYSNIQKLRRNRILPLGFEIAALMADPDNPENGWTLGDVVGGFDDCDYIKNNNGEIIGIEQDPKLYPYCRLIDPNWILKAPEARCEALVYSTNLLDNTTGNRAQECVDIKTCLKEEESGTGVCRGDIVEPFGYCYREKNVWRLSGDRCPSQFNTCTTFSSEEGNVSYLMRTLDFGECSFESIGCLAYSTEQVDGEWQATVAMSEDDELAHKKEGRNPSLYFNDKINNYDCSPDKDGCSDFYLTSKDEDGKFVKDSLIQIKKAPGYLGCYDMDKDTPEVDWPETGTQLKTMEFDERCENYAQVCVPEEMECDSYTPVNNFDFSPISGALSVPGIIGVNGCEEECIGYDVFKQESTEFAPSEFPKYFIPSQAETCLGTYSGCDEFTNIDEVAKGGEGLEYYTSVKYCEKPAEDNEEVYYSWQGSKTEGYVLKTHKLKPIDQADFDYLELIENDLGLVDEDVEDVYPVGSPAYASDKKDVLKLQYEDCNSVEYNNLINGVGTPGLGETASLDCRALYDSDGEVFYRLLKKTVTVSESCHPLRKTESHLFVDSDINSKIVCENKKGLWTSQDSKCERCYAGGFYEDGHCIYWTITSESQSCPMQSNGCREYIGNAGNNVENIVSIDFEPLGDDLKPENWFPESEVQLAAEAIQVGSYSMQVKDDLIYYKFDKGELVSGGWYELVFWARGAAQKFDIYFRQDNEDVGRFTFALDMDSDAAITVGNEWREYSLGPIQFTGLGSEEVELVFEASEVDNQPVGTYFIDSLRVQWMEDHYPVIKDSWKQNVDYLGVEVISNVPITCDEVPIDAFPGKYLGCKAYEEESTGEAVPLVGFESLCRPEAIGCRAMIDTYNTEEEGETAYNAWCEGVNENKKCELYGGGELLGECKVASGATGCFIEKVVLPGTSKLQDSAIVKSTVIIPADTSLDSPVYLTNREEYRCTGKDVGCQSMGVEIKLLPNNDLTSFDHSDVSFLNNPELYTGKDGILCRDDLVGCEEFKTNDAIYYFKDPKLTGSSFCEYKKDVSDQGINKFGWFKKEVGYCYAGTGEEAVKIDDPVQLCRQNTDCGEGNSCQDIGIVPCYEDYLLAGGEYDIWSNESENYDNLVGLCPAQSNGCTELIDPADTSSIHPLGQPYYAIYDDRLLERVDECEGQVSLKQGCVLFNKTDDPNLLYDSSASYKKSELQTPKFDLVTPVSTENNNTNRLLKVMRDRECAEWLACRGSLPLPDTQSESAERFGCYALQACEQGSAMECIKEPDNSEFTEDRLGYESYVNRDVSWPKGREFSGYSLYEQFPIANLDFLDLDAEDIDSLEEDQLFVVDVADGFNSDCAGGSIKNGEKCGWEGVCYNGQCINSPNGSYPDEIENSATVAKNTFYKYLFSNECRGYPEESSPYPHENIVSEWNKGQALTIDPLYAQASICQDGEDCDCNYVEIQYGERGSADETRYYELGSKNQDLKKGGICQSGVNEGDACITDYDCNEQGDETGIGVCVRQQKKFTRIGWNGYCLERDYSRHVNGRTDNSPEAFACLTWYPLDYVPNLFDVYYNDPKVGYLPPSEPGNPGKLYCAEMLGLSGLSYDDDNILECDLSGLSDGLINENYCQDWVDNINNSGAVVIQEGFSDPDLITGWGSWGEDDPLNFRRVQDLTWTLINGIQPNNGLGGGGYHYLARVDVGVVPDYNNKNKAWDYQIWDAPGGTLWSSTPYSKDFKLALWQKQSAILNAMVMSTQGKGHKPYAPLFPDVEWPDAASSNSWHLSSFSDNTDVEGFAINNFDSGILIHQPNLSEEILYKDMIYAVSFVPLWYSERGVDDGTLDEAPALGFPMTIYLDKDYPKEGTATAEHEIDMYKHGAQKCEFCKYWVMKTEHESSGGDSEGYLLQWFTADPINGGGSSENNGFVEYSNSDSYLVNPLREDHVNCDDTQDADDHFVAVEVLFDEVSGKFNGYRSRNCMRLDGTEFGYAMAVVFTLRPFCAEAVQVYDDSLPVHESTNKAWTNKVWFDSEVQVPNNTIDYIEKDMDAFPFGSARFSSLSHVGAPYVNSIDPWFYVYPDPGSDVVHAGNPWICREVFGDAADTAEFKGSCPSGVEFWQKANLNFGYQSEEDISSQIDKKFNLHELFVKAFKVFSKVDTINSVMEHQWGEKVAPTNTCNDAFCDKAEDYGKPPVIFALSEDCQDKVCTKEIGEKNTFSINLADGKEAADGLYSKGSLFAIARFYAMADHDQMPIKKIMVDWREDGMDSTGTVSGDVIGFYKNHKPFCSDDGDAGECVSNGVSTGLTCETQADCFGNGSCKTDIGPKFGNLNDRACTDNPVVRSFNYTCLITAEDKAGYNNGLVSNTKGGVQGKPHIYKVAHVGSNFGVSWSNLLEFVQPEDQDYVCVFKPRVQILDNWGWCSGHCEGQDQGCYNDDDAGECEPGVGEDAWIEYEGIVVVSP